MQRESLNILNKFQADKTTLRQFKIVQKQDSFLRYLKIMMQFLCFLMRTASTSDKNRLYKLDPNINSYLTEVIQLGQDYCEGSDPDSTMQSTSSRKREGRRKGKQIQRQVYTYNSDIFFFTDNSDSESDEDDASENIGSDDGSESGSSSSDDEDNVGSQLKQSRLQPPHISVMNLLIAFIQQLTEDNDFSRFDSAINVFFACKSIDIKQDHIRDSALMSQMYSAFIYCSQLLTVVYCSHVADSPSVIPQSFAGVLSDFMSQHFHNHVYSALFEILSL